MAPGGSASPTIPVTAEAQAAHKTTASKPLLSINKSIAKHISGSGIRMDITNTTTVKKILTTHGLVLPMAGTILKQLAVSIFKLSISANLGATYTEILRAFAIILHDTEQSMDMTNIINRIENLIGGPLTILEEKVEELAEVTEKHKNTLENAVLEVHGNLNGSAVGIDKVTEHATHIINQQVHNDTDQIRSDRPKTYATVTRTGIC
ncbi:uncharacterized protein EDB91DRAFT_1253082 [Suillus paluster]|uniref:uncharacterized protein n=1 Tax=Suillus paluster TaxID=48578 RepID=UPI001B86B8E3|nr:uncharacterized protein EDB91DRAFT_1253082 [Suillus paluster]KAG1729341.1 hypothetical protein EDB91DRAFT_1253082 [Suillus paluster]